MRGRFPPSDDPFRPVRAEQHDHRHEHQRAVGELRRGQPFAKHQRREQRRHSRLDQRRGEARCGRPAEVQSEHKGEVGVAGGGDAGVAEGVDFRARGSILPS
jgi:hypothetical protein